jgi:predicted naringenin-chalcone synthase
MREVWISHLGHALPGSPVTQDEAVRWMEPRLRPGSARERFHRFAQRSGIAFRHTVLDIHGPEGDAFYPAGDGVPADMGQRSRAFEAKALPLSLAAVANACPQGVGDITHIVVATCTGAVAPGLDIQLAKALGLRSDVRRTCITFMGCYAAIPALRTAWYTCRAEPTARVLVVCCELSTLHLKPGPEDDKLIAALLFADGASAAVVESSTTPIGTGLRIAGDGSALLPDSEDQMTWQAAHDGFSLTISPKVHSSIGHDVLPFATRLLGPGRSVTSMRWAVHPGGPRIIESVERKLGLRDGSLDASRTALAEGGNRSSATIMTILERELRQDWRGDIVLVAFGPGLTADALVVERCA